MEAIKLNISSAYRSSWAEGDPAIIVKKKCHSGFEFLLFQLSHANKWEAVTYTDFTASGRSADIFK